MAGICWEGEEMIWLLLGVRISAVIGRLLGDGEIVVTGEHGRHVEALLVLVVIVKGIIGH